jgi:putative peptidoglycan lipid II flippase
LLLVLVAPLIMWVFARGFESETRDLSVRLVRIMMPSIMFMGFSGVLTGLLYARQQFTLPAISVAAYNAGIIVMAFLFHDRFGVESLVVGVLVGSSLQVAVQLPGLARMRYHLGVSLRHPGVRRIALLYIPVSAGLVVSAIGVAIDSNLASRTGEGNMAAMRFATTLTQFPLGLIGAAASFAVLPLLSRQASKWAAAIGARAGGAALSPEARHDSPPPASAPVEAGEAERDQALAGYKSTLALGLKMILIAIIPATVGLILLRVPIVELLFQHGKFDPRATDRTATAFLAYSPGLAAAAIDQLLVFSFYARKNTITPVLVGVGSVGIYVVVGISLLGPMGMPGLALANSAQWVSHAVVMVWLVRRAVGGLGGLGLERTGGKVLLATAAMAGVVALARLALRSVGDGGTIAGLTAHIVLCAAAGVATYAALLVLLRVPEVRDLLAALRRAVLRQQPTAGALS